ncbi:nicotinate-nucleotide adenylyltransferase [bacterium]|nr:nicotinate-nucleotide adenylyltransferase [bacterium]
MIKGKIIKRKGIFGGTFNPLHIGHLLCCEEVREKFALSNVTFIPSAVPPHKSSPDIIHHSYRYEMVKLGIKDNPFFEVSDIELNAPGKSYSINTIKKFLTIYGEGIRLFFIMGIDAFLDIETWKEPEELVSICHLIVMLRPGLSLGNTLHKLPEYLQRRIVFDTSNEDLIHYYDPQKNILFVKVTEISLSSTWIRERIKAGKSIKYYIPREVEVFIELNELYRGVNK